MGGGLSMGVLSDKEIRRARFELFHTIKQPLSVNIQPCSVDLRLDDTLKTVDGEEIHIPYTGYVLEPFEFILGSTIEYVTLPNDLLGRVEGRSSIGRQGVMCHVTAGVIDPGFHGNITLELFNCSKEPFTLHAGDPLCQIVFETLNRPCEKPYNGKYQGDIGVVNSRWK